MYFGTSSITNTSIIKIWNSPSALNNNSQNVEGDQYGHTSSGLAEYFDDIKCLIVFGIKDTGGASKLFSFDQSTGKCVYTLRAWTYVFRIKSLSFIIGMRSKSIYGYFTPLVC